MKCSKCKSGIEFLFDSTVDYDDLKCSKCDNSYCDLCLENLWKTGVNNCDCVAENMETVNRRARNAFFINIGWGL